MLKNNNKHTSPPQGENEHSLQRTQKTEAHSGQQHGNHDAACLSVQRKRRAVYLEVVGCEGLGDFWRQVQAWRAGQREVAVQILPSHCLLHQPVNRCTAHQTHRTSS